MRTLNSGLLAAQKLTYLEAAYKVTLTHASPPGEQDGTYIYYLDNNTESGRILKKILGHEEQLFEGKATLVLDNSDKALNDIDFKGYTVVISYGAWISDAGVYSDCTDVKVIDQDYTDSPGDLSIILYCESEMSMLGHDRASDSVVPTDSDTRTVKDWIREIMGDTGKTHLAEFNHCTAYDVAFDSEDSMMTNYVPKDGFRIYRNSTRKSAIRRLLDMTQCIARFEDDGELHVFNPTITGATYDYEYKFNVANEHEFFSKRYRDSSTVPNYIVVDSLPDATAYQGTANTSEKIGEFRAYFQRALASDAEGNNLAAAILAKFQLHRNIGQTIIPFINAGQEVGDYIKITSSRSGKDRTGNVSKIVRNVDPFGETYMQVTFGGWKDAKRVTALLETYDDNYAAMERLQVKNLYAESIQAEDINLTSIDQDDIADGTTYARVLSTHISEGRIQLTAETVVNGFDLDGMPDGSVYERVRATQISEGKIELASTSYLVNEEQVRLGVGSQNRLELKSTGIKGFSYSGQTETEEFHIDATDGTIKAGAGDVVIGSDGIKISGNDNERITFHYSGDKVGSIDYSNVFGNFRVFAGDGKDMYLATGLGDGVGGGNVVLYTTDGDDVVIWNADAIYPGYDYGGNSPTDLGLSNRRFKKLYVYDILASNEIEIGGDLNIDGDLNHDGSNIGFFGTAPAVKDSVADLSLAPYDVAGGDTVDESDIEWYFALHETKINEIINALQSYGLL